MRSSTSDAITGGDAKPRLVPFAYGFRAFFLLAGIDAIFNMAAWLFAYFEPDAWPASPVMPIYWHAHEMLFGFVAAAIAGFLLTAVPGWTGRSSYAGKPLGLLAALWLAGRVALAPQMHIPAMLGTGVDLAFFPALALTLAPSLIQARKFRNLPFLVLLAALFLANLAFHLGTLGIFPAGEQMGLGLAIDVVCMLIVVIGGRIIPAFTRGGLSKIGIPADIRSHTLLEFAAITSIVAALLADIIAPISQISGAVALSAGLTQALRLSQWHSRHTLREPLLWVLHLGYVWLATGFVLKGIWLLFAADFAAKWIHALTVGAFSTMILAVMTRASLGHTGRALIAPAPMAITYLLVTLAAVIRILGPALAPQHYGQIIALAGTLWISAFGLFLWVYTPILMRPRVDGKPG